ncbi:hypothetical protein SEVIR_4G290301v4 [Setaria viridis]
MPKLISAGTFLFQIVTPSAGGSHTLLQIHDVKHQAEIQDVADGYERGVARGLGLVHLGFHGRLPLLGLVSVIHELLRRIVLLADLELADPLARGVELLPDLVQAEPLAPPCVVEGDDLVDEIGGSEAVKLGLADNVKTWLAGAEQVAPSRASWRRGK